MCGVCNKDIIRNALLFVCIDEGTTCLADYFVELSRLDLDRNGKHALLFEIVVDLIERDFVRLFEFRNTPSSESIRLVKGEEVKVVLGLMSNWEYQLSTYYDLIGTDKGAGTLDALSDNEWKPSGDFIKSNGVAQWRLEEDY